MSKSLDLLVKRSKSKLRDLFSEKYILLNLKSEMRIETRHLSGRYCYTCSFQA